MGYRSDVVAIFYTIPIARVGDASAENEALNKRNIATLDMFVRENFPESLKSGSDEDGLHRDEANSRVVWRFQNTSVKWYDSFPEVQAFEAFWDKLVKLADNQEEGDDPVFWACELIRIGENDDDVETKASHDADWLLRLNRSIELNY